MLVFMTYNVRRRIIPCRWGLKLVPGIPYLCGRRRRCYRALPL